MVESTDYCDLLHISRGKEDVIGKSLGEKLLGITLGAAHICKPGVDEGAGPVLSGESFEGARDANLDREGPEERYSMGIS